MSGRTGVKIDWASDWDRDAALTTALTNEGQVAVARRVAHGRPGNRDAVMLFR